MYDKNFYRDNNLDSKGKVSERECFRAARKEYDHVISFVGHEVWDERDKIDMCVISGATSGYASIKHCPQLSWPHGGYPFEGMRWWLDETTTHYPMRPAWSSIAKADQIWWHVPPQHRIIITDMMHYRRQCQEYGRMFLRGEISQPNGMWIIPKDKDGKPIRDDMLTYCLYIPKDMITPIRVIDLNEIPTKVTTDDLLEMF